MRRYDPNGPRIHTPWYVSGPPPSIMVPRASASRHPKRHLDPLSRFCSAHARDRQTDRQTVKHTDRQRQRKAVSYATNSDAA